MIVCCHHTFLFILVIVFVSVSVSMSMSVPMSVPVSVKYKQLGGLQLGQVIHMKVCRLHEQVAAQIDA